MNARVCVCACVRPCVRPCVRVCVKTNTTRDTSGLLDVPPVDSCYGTSARGSVCRCELHLFYVLNYFVFLCQCMPPLRGLP